MFWRSRLGKLPHMSACQADFELRFRGKMQYKVQDPNESQISQNFGLDLEALAFQGALDMENICVAY